MSKNGFTLIELIMAMVIGAIILSGLLGVFINSPIRNPGLEAVNTAVQLATGKMELVANQSFGTINSQAVTPFGGNFSSYNSQVVVNCVSSTEPDVSVDPTATNYKKIRVIITSTSLPGGSVEVTSLATDVTNP